MGLRSKSGLIALILLIAIACGEAPVLPEAEAAKEVEKRLWEAGASVFVPGDYEIFRNALRMARIHEIQAKDQFFLWRKMDRVREEYQQLIKRGESLLKIIEEKKKTSRKLFNFQASEARRNNRPSSHYQSAIKLKAMKSGRE